MQFQEIGNIREEDNSNETPFPEIVEFTKNRLSNSDKVATAHYKSKSAADTRYEKGQRNFRSDD